MDPFSLDHIFSCSSSPASFSRSLIRISRVRKSYSHTLRLSVPHASLAPVFPVPMDRLHASLLSSFPRVVKDQRPVAEQQAPPTPAGRVYSRRGSPRPWRYGDLNPRPMACKATALATELYPRALRQSRRRIYRKGRRVGGRVNLLRARSAHPRLGRNGIEVFYP